MRGNERANDASVKRSDRVTVKDVGTVLQDAPPF
jgi:hypothetical protein